MPSAPPHSALTDGSQVNPQLVSSSTFDVHRGDGSRPEFNLGYGDGQTVGRESDPDQLPRIVPDDANTELSYGAPAGHPSDRQADLRKDGMTAQNPQVPSDGKSTGISGAQSPR